MDYRNTGKHWFTKDLYYTISVELVNKTEFKALQAVYTKKLDDRAMYNRHALHFVFIQTGKLIEFNFQKFLVTLVSGIGLFSFSSFVIDILIAHFTETFDCLKGYFPWRVLMGKLKYRRTMDLYRLNEEEIEKLANNPKEVFEYELEEIKTQ